MIKPVGGLPWDVSRVCSSCRRTGHYEVHALVACPHTRRGGIFSSAYRVTYPGAVFGLHTDLDHLARRVEGECLLKVWCYG